MWSKPASSPMRHTSVWTSIGWTCWENLSPKRSGCPAGMCVESNNLRTAAPKTMPAMRLSPSRMYTVEAVDLSTASDELLREANDLSNEMSRQSVPDDPPRPFEVLARRVRNRPRMLRVRDWLARASDGRVVARSYMVRFEADTNQHLRQADIDVLPAPRRNRAATPPVRATGPAAGHSDGVV